MYVEKKSEFLNGNHFIYKRNEPKRRNYALKFNNYNHYYWKFLRREKKNIFLDKKNIKIDILFFTLKTNLLK